MMTTSSRSLSATPVDDLVSGDPTHLTELSDPDPPVLIPRQFLERLRMQE